MWNERKIKFLFFAFVIVFLTAGCASVEKLETSEKVNKNDELEQSIIEKDAKISQLQELLNDQQEQLRQLNDSLNDCKEKLKDCYKNQPNLK